MAERSYVPPMPGLLTADELLHLSIPDKRVDWLAAGTRLVWVIDPDRRVARVYRHDGTERIVAADETLDGEDIVPGFSCPLSAIF